MVRKAIPVVLFFYAGDITQAQVTAIDEALRGNDVRYRKVIRDAHRDIIEDFDAVAGDVPDRYLAVAHERGKKLIDIKISADEEGEQPAATAKTTDLSAGKKDEVIAPPTPTDATQPPATPAAVTPPPAPAAVVPPPAPTKG